MTSENITPEQAAALARQLDRHAGYLSRLVRRMQGLHWPDDDDALLSRALRARDALISLAEAAEEAAERNAKPAWMRAMGR